MSALRVAFSVGIAEQGIDMRTLFCDLLIAIYCLVIGLTNPVAAQETIRSEAVRQVEDFKPRVLVTGMDAKGRSIFASDRSPLVRQIIPMATMVPVWQVEILPSQALADSSTKGLDKDAMPPNGFRIKLVSLKSDAVLGRIEQRRRNYVEAFTKMGNLENARSHHVPGFHATDTVDVITVISGEVYSIMETGEKLHRPGDTLVQRGTSHAWSNRGQTPAIFVVTE